MRSLWVLILQQMGRGELELAGIMINGEHWLIVDQGRLRQTFRAN